MRLSLISYKGDRPWRVARRYRKWWTKWARRHLAAPVRLKDVDESQMLLVQTAKDLAARGELVLASGKGEEELIY